MTLDIAKLQCGDKVLYGSRLERRATDEHVYAWKSCPITQQVGIFLGTRTLKDGYMDKDGCFVATDHFKAALICPNATTNPYYVALDALQPLVKTEEEDVHTTEAL